MDSAINVSLKMPDYKAIVIGLKINPEEPVGTFLKWDPLQEPMYKTTITAEDITFSGVRTLSEALEVYVPGFVYMIQKWVGTSWAMRGVSSETLDKFTFLINGIRQTMLARDGALSEVDLGLLGDIEYIEVVHGPTGIRYGSGAIAGVVSIVTKKRNIYKINNHFRFHFLGENNYAPQFDSQLFKIFTPRDTLFINGTFGYRRSDGIGQKRGSLWGYPSSPYPDYVPIVPKDWVPVTGSAGATPGNYKAALDLEYNNLHWYTRFTKQVQQSSGWFVYDPWKGKATDSESTTFPVDIPGEYNQIEHIDSTHPLSNFLRETIGNGFNRRVYQVDNLFSTLSYNFGVGRKKQDTCLVRGDFTSASEYVLLEKTDQYNLAEDSINQAFGEYRMGIDFTYTLNRLDRFKFTTGAELRHNLIGKDIWGDNKFRERENVPVIDNVRYTNCAFYLESFTEIIDSILGLHAGIRFDKQFRNYYDDRKDLFDFIPLVSPKISLIATMSPNNAIKLIWQQSSNYGNAENYERNYYFTNTDGSPANEYHYESPHILPEINTPILLPFDLLISRVIDSLQPEKSQSLECITTNYIPGRRVNVFLQGSFSYNRIVNLFLWNQDLFRRINIPKYDFINVCLESKVASRKISVGCNHVIQRVVNTNYDTIEILPLIIPNKNPDSLCTQDPDGTYHPFIHPDSSFDNDTLSGLHDVITSDGKNFINIPTHITKLFIDYTPVDWLHFHCDTRIFWALNGRKNIIDSIGEWFKEENNGDTLQADSLNFADIDTKPIIKLNAGVTFTLYNAQKRRNIDHTLFRNVAVSLFCYDILAPFSRTGGFATRNSFRWQQLSEPSERDLYAVDIFSVGMHLTANF